jgi:hypothetical protein
MQTSLNIERSDGTVMNNRYCREHVKEVAQVIAQYADITPYEHFQH